MGATPPLIKRAARVARIELPLKAVKRSHARAIEGAVLQIGFWTGHLPVRWVRHLIYRALGVSLARTAILHRGLELRAPPGIAIGEGTIVGFDAILDGRGGLTLGRNVNISSEVAIWTADHSHRSPTFETRNSPVVVHDRAWLSFRTTVLPGVTIGQGAVVASGAVVTKDVAPFTVVAGTPARVVGTRQTDLRYEFRGQAPWFI